MTSGATSTLRDLARVIDRQAQPVTKDMDIIAAANRSLTVGELAAAQIGAEGLPPDLFQFYFSILSRIQQRNRALLRQLREVGKALNREGIVPILIKGSADLAERGDALPRLLSDLDIMVSRSEQERAVSALVGIGFAVMEGGASGAGATLGRSKDVGAVDLHTVLKARLPRLSYEALVAASKPIEVQGAKFLLPSAVVRAAILIVHDQLQERDYWTGAIDLRHLHDVARLSRSFGPTEWAELGSYFPQGSPQRAFRSQLAMLGELFGPLPAEASAEGVRVRMQLRRRLAQLRWPWLRLPLTLVSLIADPPKSPSERTVSAKSQADRRLRKAAGRYLYRRRIGKY